MNNEIAVYGGGCFWCTEAIFKRVKGVDKVEPGYAGGHLQNPTYYQVCDGNTGHAEVIRIEFDPDVISYPELLEVFWHAHDPTTKNRQGNDIGSQYRSVILTTSDTHLLQAQASLKTAGDSGMFRRSIVTEIQPLDVFYTAEEYHYDYFANNPNQPYCRAIISPKVNHFFEKFSDIQK